MNILIGFKSRFVIRTLLPTLITISLFITSIFIILIPQFENIIYDRKREMIRELTNSAWNILVHVQSQEEEGLITQRQAQESAVRQIERLRYGSEGKDYFWITDHTPFMIMHPYRPDLNGKSLVDFEDSHGKRLFLEMAELVKRSNEGFVDYTWQWKDDSSRIVPKLSFVKGFEPWSWIIGTGIYIEDVKEEIASLERRIIEISIGITVLISLLMLSIALQNYRTERQRLQAEQELHESREKYRTLVETSTEGLIMVMSDQEIFCNKALYAMLGYPNGHSGEIQYKNLFPARPKSELFDFASFTPIIGKDIRNEQLETKIMTVHGTLLDVLLLLSPIMLLKKEGIVLSIKSLRRDELYDEGIYDRREHFHDMMSKYSIGAFSSAPDIDGRILAYNTTVEKLLGANERDTLYSSTLRSLFDDGAECNKFFSVLMERGIVINWITTLQRLDGVKIIAQISLIVQKNKQGVPISFEGILCDITAQQRSERERENLISDVRIPIGLLSQTIQPLLEEYPLCDITATVGSAVRLMTRHRRDAVLVTTATGEITGIVTERDVRIRALTHAALMDTPVHTIMTSPVLSLPSTSSVFDVLQMFSDNNISHAVAVGVDDKPVGIVHEREVQKTFHTSYLSFFRRIESLETVRDLKEYHSRLQYLMHLLISGRAAVSECTEIATMISQAITRRLISLAQNELGEPPVPFAFLVLGSDGRKEQTLLSDQDNAIVYANPPPDQSQSAETYFLRLGEQVCNNLNAIGYHFCKGGIMAKNKKWCQPVSVWKTYFTDWVTTANPQNILDIKIFFDFRSVFGHKDIVDSLLSTIKKLLTGNDPFFVYLSESILSWEIPEGAVKLKSPFDIKKLMVPLVDIVRLQSLRHQITATNTLERLYQLQEKGVYTNKNGRELTELYSFLLRKRLEHQNRFIDRGLNPDNMIDPDECSEYDLIFFKKGVSHINTIKEKLSLEMKGIRNR